MCVWNSKLEQNELETFFSLKFHYVSNLRFHSYVQCLSFTFDNLDPFCGVFLCLKQDTSRLVFVIQFGAKFFKTHEEHDQIGSFSPKE